MSGVKWTADQVKSLKELYPDCYMVDDLVSIIGRDKKSIYYKAAKMGLKRNSNPGNKNLAEYGKRNRFIKGHKPWNKGLKGINIGGVETQFKKGNVPKNTKYFGKPYLVKRKRGEITEMFWVIQELGSNKRQLYNRYLWKLHYGSLPKGQVVYYKNGINENNPPQIEDLGIMSKAENMNRNTIHRYPAELKKSIRLVNKLKKQINETN